MLGSLNTSMEDDDCFHGHRTSTPLSNYVEPDFNLENNDCGLLQSLDDIYSYEINNFFPYELDQPSPSFFSSERQIYSNGYTIGLEGLKNL